LLASFVKVYSK